MNSIQELTKGAYKALVPTMNHRPSQLFKDHGICMRSFEHHKEVRQTTAQTVVPTHTLAEQGGWSKGCKHIHDGARRLTVVYVTTCKCTCSARKQFHT